MSTLTWHCKRVGCTWTGPDGPAVLVHHGESGHRGAYPTFCEPAPQVPPLFRAAIGGDGR